MKIIKSEEGFVVSVTAIIIAVILGLLVLYFSNSVSINVTNSANNYSSSQARWSGVSGMEHVIYKLSTGVDDIAGVYPFSDGDIIIDTLTINPVDGTMQFTSRGTHSSSNRIFALTALPLDADSLIDEGFDDDSTFIYTPTGEGPGENRFWGFTCADSFAPPPDVLPLYVLQGADSCFFFGTKLQNNANLTFLPMEAQPGQDYILRMSLAAGTDWPQVSKQTEFGAGDFLEFSVNGIMIEHWAGVGLGGKNPMCPTIGNSPDCLTQHFEDYDFNLTNIIGEVDTFRLEFEGHTNKAIEYIGIEGISLLGPGGWAVIGGSYTEI